MIMVLLSPVPKEKGQSLIEVIVAIFIIILVFTAIIFATVLAVKKAQFSKNQNLAEKYAQEGIETVRNFRDLYPELFWQKNGTDPEEVIGDFTRKTEYTLISEGEIKVTITVSWKDSLGNHKIKQSSVFTKW